MKKWIVFGIIPFGGEPGRTSPISPWWMRRWPGSHLVPWHHPDLCLYLIWHSPCVYVLWVQIPLFMSCLDCKEIKPVNPKGNKPWMFIGRTDAEAPILWPPDMKSRLTGKDWKNAGKDWRQKEKGMAEDEMFGWHYPLNDTNLSKLWEIVEDRGAWHTVHRVPKSWT